MPAAPHLFVAAIFAALCSGCAARPGAPGGRLPARDVSSDRPPVDVTVADESNDGRDVLVVAEIRPAAAAFSGTVKVVLVALRDGTPTARSEPEILEFPPGGLSTPKLVRLKAASAGATDYQLDVSYGPTPPSREPAPAPVLSFEDQELSREHPECEAAPCPVYYRVTGRLSNTGAAAVDDPVLAVGFRRAGTTGPGAAEGEETVVLKGVTVPGGGSVPVSLRVDRALSEEEAARFVPAVRVAGEGGGGDVPM